MLKTNKTMTPTKFIPKGQASLLMASIAIDEQLIKEYGYTGEMLTNVLVMKRNALRGLTNTAPEFTEIKL